MESILRRYVLRKANRYFCFPLSKLIENRRLENQNNISFEKAAAREGGGRLLQQGHLLRLIRYVPSGIPETESKTWHTEIERYNYTKGVNAFTQNTHVRNEILSI